MIATWYIADLSSHAQVQATDPRKFSGHGY
jgi:hypothetical protein